MPSKRGRAGKSTYEMAFTRRKTGFTVAIILLLISICTFLFFISPIAKDINGTIPLIVIIGLSSLVYFGKKYLDRNEKAEKRAIKGAKAEEKVADLLANLDTKVYQFFHDIRSPYGNIDHVVFNKYGGIFIIETKSHGGNIEIVNDEILLNGHPCEKNIISQSLNNAYWMKKRVEEITKQNAWIVSVIVFTNAFVNRTPPIKGVNILNKKFLIQFILNNRSTSPGGKQFWIQWQNRSSKKIE